MVQESLTAYADDPENDATSVSDPKARCSRIHFSEDFHIDVPSYHLDDARDARALATADNAWEESDPKAIYQWWTKSLDAAARDRARRMVRYMKMWAALNFDDEARPSSILLTVLVGEAYPALDQSKLTGDDEVFRAVAAAIRDRLEGSYVVANPANKREDLNRLGDAESAAFLDKLNTLVACADRGLAALNPAESAEVWAEAFAHFFPIPDDQVLVEMVKSAGASLPALAFVPEVAVQALTQGVLRQSYSGRNAIGPIPKDCSITFTLANALALPPGAVVSWTVRNEGDEAEAVNDLGHVVGHGMTVNEHSAYNGLHHMDVAVKLNGRLIGRRRVPVEIQGKAVFRRARGRPANIKLRARR